MLPFLIELGAGAPIYEQIVEAVRRAVASGRLKEGDRFPSVRAISAELRVNPNTVQKAVAAGLPIAEAYPDGSTTYTPPPAALW